MTKIRKIQQLIGNGETQLNRKARALALKSLESALKAVDPRQIIESRLSLKDSVLKVNGHSFDFKKLRNVYVVGGGKAGGSMAEALERILGKHITAGFVNVPTNSKHKTKIVELHEASHPSPDQSGVEGTQRMVEIAEQSKKEDLVICLVSGGGSSLMPLTRGQISIADKRSITEDLLKSGAPINEINTVRKHISDFKGGWLAKRAYPATILNLILSDVVGDPLDSIASGPTVPDSTTFGDAIKVLKRYCLWDKAPTSISDKAFKRVYNVVVGNNRSASLAACEYLKSAELNTLMLTSTLEGEARYAGVTLASIAREVSVSGNPVPKPAGIVAGGETTVTVTGKGLGGRNQEIVLAAALKLGDMDGVVIASLSTDGVDGPTDAAGAIADGKTLVRGAEMELSADGILAENNSYNFFSKLGDLVFTGPTGTNVNDISVIVVV